MLNTIPPVSIHLYYKAAMKVAWFYNEFQNQKEKLTHKDKSN